jgi:hypothetical protein
MMMHDDEIVNEVIVERYDDDSTSDDDSTTHCETTATQIRRFFAEEHSIEDITALQMGIVRVNRGGESSIHVVNTETPGPGKRVVFLILRHMDNLANSIYTYVETASNTPLDDGFFRILERLALRIREDGPSPGVMITVISSTDHHGDHTCFDTPSVIVRDGNIHRE